MSHRFTLVRSHKSDRIMVWDNVDFTYIFGGRTFADRVEVVEALTPIFGKNVEHMITA